MIFYENRGVELLGIRKKDPMCLSGTSGWFDDCISYLGTSVQPPLQMTSFEKITLCLIVAKLERGLTPRHNYEKFTQFLDKFNT